MSSVVTYRNNERQCFCQIKFDTGERVLVSMAAAPTPSVKVLRLALGGLVPRQTIWEYNPTMAGGYNAYVENMLKMFPPPDDKPAHPLDVIRDALLPCGSLREAQRTLLKCESKASKTAPQKPESLLDAALDLVSAYGAALETAEDLIVDVARLPAPKATIKSALLIALRATTDPQVREQLKIGYLSLATFQPGVGDSPVGLQNLPPADADAERMSEYLKTGKFDEFQRWSSVRSADWNQLVAELTSAGFWEPKI